MMRYETADGVDGLPPGEGAFLACSFWLADSCNSVSLMRVLFEWKPELPSIAWLVVPADIDDLSQHVVTPPPRRAARFRNAARTASAILCAVLTSAIWENAWGKL